MSLEPPKYIPGSDEWQRRLDEALRANEVPLEVHIFGVTEYEIVGDKVQYVEDGVTALRPISSEIDLCPVCGKLLKILFIKGVPHVGTCGDEHAREVMAFIDQQQQRAQKRGSYKVVGGR